MSEKLTYSIFELVAAMTARADAVLGSGYGMTFNQFHFLAVVRDIEPDDITAIAACLGVSKAAVSKRVPALIARGWITTARDPGHGRRVVVSMTDNARVLVDQASAELDAAMLASYRHPLLDRKLHPDALGPDELNRHIVALTTVLSSPGESPHHAVAVPPQVADHGSELGTT